MPVPTEATRTVLGGNGSATAFPFGFHVSDSSSLSVFYIDANGTTTLLPPSAYGIAYNGSGDGGVVYYAANGTPIASGTSLAIVRSVPLTQLVDIANQGAFYPQVVVREFDQLAMADQQLADELSRTLQAPVGDPPGMSLAIPGVAQRANRVLGFDPSGNPVAYAPGSIQSGDANATYYTAAAPTRTGPRLPANSMAGSTSRPTSGP